MRLIKIGKGIGDISIKFGFEALLLSMIRRKAIYAATSLKMHQHNSIPLNILDVYGHQPPHFPPSLIRYSYFAKWKSQVSNHFIPANLPALHPGTPYVMGANHKNTPAVAKIMTAPTALNTVWSWSLIATTGLLGPFSPRVPGTTTPGDTGPSNPRENRNWVSAPVTRQEQRWAGR